MKNPSVSIIIVNYNSYDDVCRLLSSLKKLTYDNYNVIIVDNASLDESGRLLQERFSDERISIILNPENSGFAAGNNLGMSTAVARGADWIWLLNADTEVDSESLSSLVKVIDDFPDTAVFGSKILYSNTHAPKNIMDTASENLPVIWSAGGEVDTTLEKVHMVGWHELDRGQYDAIRICSYVPGCSMFVDAGAISEVGYMNEEYFMYFEETDWCLRLQQAGKTLRYVPQSVVWHYFDDNKVQQPFGVYYYNRNSLLFWTRFGQKGMIRKVILSLKELPKLINAFYKAPNSELKALFRAHLLAKAHFLLHRFGAAKI